MNCLLRPLKYAYRLVFPDAGGHAHDQTRFALFSLLIFGLLLSGAALGTVGWP